MVLLSSHLVSYLVSDSRYYSDLFAWYTMELQSITVSLFFIIHPCYLSFIMCSALRKLIGDFPPKKKICRARSARTDYQFHFTVAIKVYIIAVLNSKVLRDVAQFFETEMRSFACLQAVTFNDTGGSRSKKRRFVPTTPTTNLSVRPESP